MSPPFDFTMMLVPLVESGIQFPGASVAAASLSAEAPAAAGIRPRPTMRTNPRRRIQLCVLILDSLVPRGKASTSFATRVVPSTVSAVPALAHNRAEMFKLPRSLAACIAPTEKCKRCATHVDAEKFRLMRRKSHERASSRRHRTDGATEYLIL